MKSASHSGNSSPEPTPSPCAIEALLSPVKFPSVGGVDPVLTQNARKWLGDLGCGPAASRVQVVWNPRLKTTAGTACVYTTRIELNPRLGQIGEHQIERTLRHEVAHLVAHNRAGKKASRLQTHGPEWRRACAELGIGGEPAFHDLPFERRTMARKYTYECPGCGLIVDRVRKFGRFTACYRCCKEKNHGRYDAKYQFRIVDQRLARIAMDGTEMPHHA
jgi:predicted SprT family Zn-dependent metalloprotease